MTQECRYCDSTDLEVCGDCHEEATNKLEDRIEDLEDELWRLRRRWLVRLADWLWGFYG